MPGPRREPVDAVGEIRAVCCTRDDQEQEGVVGVRERDVDVGDRNVDRGVELRLRVDREPHDNRDRREPEELPPALEAERAAVAELDEVVQKANRAAGDRHEEHRQRRQREFRKRQEGQERTEQDQQASHHRCPLLDDVTGGAVFPDRLAQLIPAQERDELRSDHDGDNHRDEARYEDSDHYATGFARAGAMPSRATERDAFTSTASPGSTSFRAASSAASASGVHASKP